MKMRNAWFAKKHFAKIVCCAVALFMFCAFAGCKNPTDSVSAESGTDTSTQNSAGKDSGTGKDLDSGAQNGAESEADNDSDADTDTSAGNGNGNGTGADTQNGTGNGNGTGADTQNGTGNGSGAGNGNGSGTQNDSGADTGNGNGAGAGNGADNGTGNGADTQNGSGAGNGADNGTGAGTDASNGNGTDTGNGNDSGGNEHSESFAHGFALPTWPPQNASQKNYPELVRWEVTYFDGEKIQKKDVTLGTATLDLPKLADFVAPIVAQPITRHGKDEVAFFFPAGCVYPHESKINWEDGWTASVALSAAKQLLAEKNPDDAVSALKKFNWENYITTVREMLVEDENGREVPYNPWINDYVKFGNSSKKLSDLSDGKRYSLDTRNLVENVKYYKENVEDKTLWKKGDDHKAGNFCADESEFKGALYMRTFEKLENSEVSKTVLVQFIPDQNIAENKNNVFLWYRKTIHLCLGDDEIISINYRGTAKNNLLIISPSDFKNME